MMMTGFGQGKETGTIVGVDAGYCGMGRRWG
jgi:hypothetical protein